MLRLTSVVQKNHNVALSGQSHVRETFRHSFAEKYRLLQAFVKRIRAAPVGWRRPCSQFCSVLTLTHMNSANTG